MAWPSPRLHHHDYYRLPWTLPDNGISWLEPTVLCNLRCDGCYRKIEGDPHKSWAAVLAELDVFQDQRKSDCISVAGGEPLLYPRIVDLVAEIRRRGFKPIINSNGVPLTPELLRDLKRAGVFGFTFHVDSRQNRGGRWHGCSELELNDLRQEYAELVAAVGGVACSFNATVYADNLDQVPGMTAWAQEHIDIVNTMVFICFRHVVPSLPFDWYAGGEKVDWDGIWYHSDQDRVVTINSRDLVAKMREVDPDFEPAAYLNGTQDPSAFKWLLTMRVGNKRRIFGYPGPKLTEAMTAWYHFRHDKYLSYMGPGRNAQGSHGHGPALAPGPAAAPGGGRLAEGVPARPAAPLPAGAPADASCSSSRWTSWTTASRACATAAPTSPCTTASWSGPAAWRSRSSTAPGCARCPASWRRASDPAGGAVAGLNIWQFLAGVARILAGAAARRRAPWRATRPCARCWSAAACAPSATSPSPTTPGPPCWRPAGWRPPP